VLILSSTNALTKTEDNANQNSTILNAVKNAADKTSTVKGKIQAMGLSDVVLVDTAGNTLSDVEWNYAPYDDGYVINVLNYNYDTDKPFKIMINGSEVGSFTDLRTGNHSNNGVMTANTLEPMLLKVKSFTLDLVNESGAVLKADIDKLQAGRIRCTTPLSGGRVILALYEDGNLVKATITGNTLEVPTLTEGKEYRLMAAYWGMGTLTPLAKSKELYQ
jgi:filamentous hemagglutinin family protein